MRENYEHSCPQTSIGRGQVQMITADDGRAFVLDVEHNRILTLNPVGAEMWQLLMEGLTESEVVARISQKYQVSSERVEADLRALVKKMSGLQLDPADSVPVLSEPRARGGAGVRAYPWHWDAGTDRPQPSAISVVAAVVGLIFFDLILWCCSMRTLCSWVNRWPTRKRYKSPDIRGKICSAVEEACLWYPKRSMCLQRSAVTTCILRSYGVAARMVIGIRPMPFMAHAWVEVDGAVLNDRAGVRKFYAPMVSYLLGDPVMNGL